MTSKNPAISPRKRSTSSAGSSCGTRRSPPATPCRSASARSRRAGADLLERAEAERHGVAGGDLLVPHELPADEVERLRGEIAGFFDVTRAYLARKAVRYLPEKPYYVVGVDLGRWYQVRTKKRNREVVHGLASQVLWPGPTWIMALNRSNASVAKRLKRVPGAELLRR